MLLLHDARRVTRADETGALVLLGDQDRTRWDHDQIAEGVELVERSLRRGLGPYQLQAAIAALHAESPTADATDWPQIAALYGELAQLDDSPVVALNRAVAIAMAEGPEAGLALVDVLEPALAGMHSVSLDPRLPVAPSRSRCRSGRGLRARDRPRHQRRGARLSRTPSHRCARLDGWPESATVVLVHGAWHGAWCWEKVVALLDKEGISATAVELPLTSLVDDVQATTSALQEIDGRAVLCGHSYGGAVITEAGHHPNVEHLVYLTAFACDTGESPSATAVEENLPFADFNDALVFSEDGTTMSVSPESAAEIFYHDCDRADVDAAVARLRPINLLCATTPATSPAWRLKPSTYVVCSEDRGLHPAMQRHLAARCTRSVEWPTAHSPFLNRPDLVASLLAELAR